VFGAPPMGVGNGLREVRGLGVRGLRCENGEYLVYWRLRKVLAGHSWLLLFGRFANRSFSPRRLADLHSGGKVPELIRGVDLLSGCFGSRHIRGGGRRSWEKIR
jgi:hypothetical protein